MADGVVAERDIVPVRDQGLVALAHRQRDEVIRLALERGRNLRGNRGDHPFQVK